MTTKLVLLGIDVPNVCEPDSAAVVDDKAFLVDFGPGPTGGEGLPLGIDALRTDCLMVAFWFNCE